MKSSLDLYYFSFYHAELTPDGNFYIIYLNSGKYLTNITSMIHDVESFFSEIIREWDQLFFPVGYGQWWLKPAKLDEKHCAFYYIAFILS